MGSGFPNRAPLEKIKIKECEILPVEKSETKFLLYASPISIMCAAMNAISSTKSIRHRPLRRMAVVSLPPAALLKLLVQFRQLGKALWVHLQLLFHGG